MKPGIAAWGREIKEKKHIIRCAGPSGGLETLWYLAQASTELCSCSQPFNTATDRILNNATQAMTLGVNYDDSGQLITDLYYADDVVIFADVFDTLKDALLTFNEQSEKLGLHVNWSKNKLQSTINHQHSSTINRQPSTHIGT